jgi:hypothetical protein
MKSGISDWWHLAQKSALQFPKTVLMLSMIKSVPTLVKEIQKALTKYLM